MANSWFVNTWQDAVAVAKSAIRAGLRDYVPLHIATATEIQSIVTNGIRCVMLAGMPFNYSSTDTTSTHNGVTVLVSSDGQRYLRATSVQETLTAARTYYVRTDGSDSNDGLANSSGRAFLTIQKAWNTAIALNMAGFTCTISVADGTYTGGISGTVGNVTGTIALTGNTTTPSNVIVSAASGFTIGAYSIVTVAGFKFTGTFVNLYIHSGCVCTHSSVDFGGSASNSQCRTGAGGIMTRGASVTVSSGALRHIAVENGGVFQQTNVTTTVSGTPNFTGAFLYATANSVFSTFNSTYSGSATGKRYDINGNSTAQTFGGSSTLLPGDVAGTTASGGQYL